MKKLIQGVLWIIGAFVIGFIFCGCDECSGSEIQCQDDVIMVCIDEVWEPRLDCASYNDREGFSDAGPFKCCDFASIAYCVPVRACEELDFYYDEKEN